MCIGHKYKCLKGRGHDATEIDMPYQQESCLAVQTK